jgi:sporulation protein YlmC with PRC-barrel domain
MDGCRTLGNYKCREKEQSLMPQDSEKIQHIDPSAPMRRVMSASTLSSDAVRNRLGEDVGAIKEIMIDVPSGQVAYAVLSFGGFLGIGQKLFAIPWAALTLDEDRKCSCSMWIRARSKKRPGLTKTIGPTWRSRPGAGRFTSTMDKSHIGSSLQQA